MVKYILRAKLYSLLILPLVFWAGGFCLAVDDSEIIHPSYDIYLDQATIVKGYTVSAFNDSLKLSLTPGILSKDTEVNITHLQEDIPSPWQLKRISEIYQFEFKNKAAYDNHKPFYIQFSYNQDSNDLKQVFFYDNNFHQWRPLPTQDYPKENFVRSLIHLPFARIAVFSNPEILSVGKASWYRYRGGDFTASPDFPRGSVLRVSNLDYSPQSGLRPYVDVVVNDYGPNRGLHPDRVVDLDLVAFNKIASSRNGIANVKIQPLFINNSAEQVLGVKINKLSSEPVIESRAAIIIDKKSGKVVYGKNADSVFPIASLTKMLTVYTFLGYKSDLNEIVEYRVKDEEYNHEHCSPWQSARIRLKEGDLVTVNDLIYASLVGSANNAVETLARVSGVSRDEFISKMNKNALNFGAVSSKFVEPSGLSSENVSSPHDYAIISREVLKNEIIQKASITSRYEFATINTQEKYVINNTNHFIRYGTSDLNLYGSKTGYLHASLHCLMISDNNYISVVLGAVSREQAAKEAEELIKYGSRTSN